MLEHAAPGSIAVASQAAKEGLSLETATYFSFVSLATLGYRAVVPRSEVARGEAIVEAVARQLDPAVMIARLVRLYVFDERQPLNSEDAGCFDFDPFEGHLQRVLIRGNRKCNMAVD